jgi:hypothetical protein
MRRSTGRQRCLEPLSLQFRVLRRRRGLDRLLAKGASPSASPELELRAYQLIKSDTRRGLANLIVNLIDAAEEPVEFWHGGGIDPPIRSQAVLDASPELVALADRLRDSRPASVLGLALVSRLVSDKRDSPIFGRPNHDSVRDRARQARAALDDPDPPAVEAWRRASAGRPTLPPSERSAVM